MSEPESSAAGSSVSLPEAELQWRFSRSSGPGGQHVNTTATQAEARWNLAETSALPQSLRDRALARLRDRLTDDGVLVVRASEHRSQWRNRQLALERMEALLRQATAPPPPRRRPTRKSRGVVERRLKDKKRRSEIKRGRGRQSGDA